MGPTPDTKEQSSQNKTARTQCKEEITEDGSPADHGMEVEQSSWNSEQNAASSTSSVRRFDSAVRPSSRAVRLRRLIVSQSRNSRPGLERVTIHCFQLAASCPYLLYILVFWSSDWLSESAENYELKLSVRIMN
jgi:hypothetical protein